MPDVNIDIGTRHLKDLDRQVRQRYPRVQGLERVKLIAAAYNAGWGRIVRAGGHVPPIWEIRGYVRRVSRYYQTYGGKLKPVARPSSQQPTKKESRNSNPPTSSETTEKARNIPDEIPDQTSDISPDFQLTRHTLMVLFVSLLMFLGYVIMSWSHLVWLIRYHSEPQDIHSSLI